jgi:nucleoid DNA-binding protein
VVMPRTLTKQQIVRTVGRQTGLRDADVSEVIESLINLLAAQLAAGGRIELQNFLVLEVQTRTRLPPHTGGRTLGALPVTYHYLKVRPSRKLRASLKNMASGG